MFTLNQKKRLNYLSHNSIQNIRDMSLLSLAYGKPQCIDFPVVYRPLWWCKPRQTIFLPGSKIQYQHIQTSFLEHFVTLDDTKKIHFAKECLLQVAKMLDNMAYYVHGDLTIQNIMISVSEANRYQFYIMDKCEFERRKYCDLRTLYMSIVELFKEPIFFNAFSSMDVFDPVLFIRHIKSI